MNIFYLDSDTKRCAQYHCDKHVVKMIIEYAQLLSTSHRVLDGKEYIDLTSNNRKIKRWLMNDEKYENGLMKATHVNHPSNVWVRQSKENYNWLVELWNCLLLEYTNRYNKYHACMKYNDILKHIPKNIPENIEFTEPPPTMPDYCKVQNNSIQSYRNLYNNEKNKFAKWTNIEKPGWFKG